jgi:hypothetical protein
MIVVQGIIVDLEFVLEQIQKNKDYHVLQGTWYGRSENLKLDIAIKRLEDLIVILDDIKDRVIE